MISELQFIPAAAVALAVTATLMFALRPVARSVNLVDRPGGRKMHVGEVPIIGGIAMFAGMFSGMLMISEPGGVLPSIALASMLLVVIGTVDDRYGLQASVRMLAQIAAVLIMVYGADLSLLEIGDPFATGLISMGRFSLVFTMLVALTMINAYNMIDGVDGLAGSLALIAMLAVAVAAGYASMPAALALVISVAIIGYLVFNFPTPWNQKVRSFMGDAGSTLLGFSIVWVTIAISQGPERLISPVHCLWFASIPIYDCLTCFVRRSLRGKSPFTSGRDHFHHTLRRGGFDSRQNLGVLAGLQLVYAVIGLAGHFAGVPDVVMFTAWAVLGLSQRFVIGRIARLYRLRGYGAYQH